MGDHLDACEGYSASRLCCGSALLEHPCWCAERDAERVEHNHKHNQARRRASKALGPHTAAHHDGFLSAFYFIYEGFTHLLYSAKTILDDSNTAH